MIKIKIKNKGFYYPEKILRNPREQELGYQFLTKNDIEPNSCLLFIFPKEEQGRIFHMENCNSFDIQLYALDANKKLVDAVRMSKGSKNKYSINAAFMYVI